MKNCLNKEDLSKCLDALGEPIRIALTAYPNQVCVAGGFIRAIIAGEKPNDIDLFTDSEQTAHRLVSVLDVGKLVKTGKAFTLLGHAGPTPQVIYKWTFPHPNEVIDAFDFTIAQAAIWFNGFSWDSNCSEAFYDDVKAKRLHYTQPLQNDAEGTFLRVLKFYRAGYSISNETLGEILAGLCQGLRPETLLGTSSNLAETFANRLPTRSNGKY